MATSEVLTYEAEPPNAAFTRMPLTRRFRYQVIARRTRRLRGRDGALSRPRKRQTQAPSIV